MTDDDTEPSGASGGGLAIAPVQVGTMVADKYRVERILGVGGMGVVVAATNTGLDQLVAVKFMLPAALGNADAVARFLREARAAVKLRSEHVARVLDVGTMATGAPYIVMEYLEGTDLKALLHERGVLSIAEVCEYILQAIDAVAEAHSLGIIHRDLKPANLFLTRHNDGTPLIKVLDFGISKSQISSQNLTSTSALMGSPAYMSPEQMRASRSVDPRTDIWSLGAVMYELVSGKPPYSAETLPELVVNVLYEPFEPLCRRAPAIMPAFAGVVERCLEKDLAVRYGNVAQLARALEAFAPNLRGTADRIAAMLKVSAGSPADDRRAHLRDRRRWWPIAAGVGGALVVGGFALFVLNRDPAATKTDERAPASVQAIVPPTSSDAKIRRYHECWNAFNARDDRAFANCYAPDAVREQVDHVPERVAHGRDAIVQMVRAQRVAFPDIEMRPDLVLVSGRSITAILRVTGTNTGFADGRKPTGKAIALYAAQVAVLGDDGMFSRDNLYIDQPTIFHQLELIPNDSSPAATLPPTKPTEHLISRGEERERINKALVEQNLEAVANADANAIEPAAANDISFVFHGEKTPVVNKAGYLTWWRDTLKTTTETRVEVKGIWAAGDVVAVWDVFSGIPARDLVESLPEVKRNRIEIHVVQFFRIAGGKIKEHRMFENRLKSQVQIGVIDPAELDAALTAAANGPN